MDWAFFHKSFYLASQFFSDQTIIFNPKGLFHPRESQICTRINISFQDQIRRDLGQRNKNAISPHKMRMGNSEALVSDCFLTIQKQIQVNCTRAPANKPLSFLEPLNLLQII